MQRAIPHGYGFGLISCPNYFFEGIAWAAVAYMSGSWSGKLTKQNLPLVFASLTRLHARSMAVLDGVDGSDDELGHEEAAYV